VKVGLSKVRILRQ